MGDRGTRAATVAGRGEEIGSMERRWLAAEGE